MAKVVKVQKAPESAKDKDQALRSLATLCYYYPAYKLSEARKLPYKRVSMMISQARRLEAIYMYNLVQIIAAPHTKKGTAVKKLSSHFKGISKNG